MINLNIGLITSFPIDYMQCSYLGVSCKLLIFWMSGNLKTRMSNKTVKRISEKIIEIQSNIPSEFNIKPRGLNELKIW